MFLNVFKNAEEPNTKLQITPSIFLIHLDLGRPSLPNMYITK